jgi:transposase
MPWRECSVMDERVRFIGRLLDGEGMSELCREFGISRKTGYKIFNRYRQDGVEALTDRSRRPVRYANQLPDQVEAMIVGLKREKPHWGARNRLCSSPEITEIDYSLYAGGWHVAPQFNLCELRTAA